MTQNMLAMKIRAKKLGVLIRDARLSAQKSVEECAQMIGTTPERFEEYEYGLSSPSLPEIEILSYRLRFPVDHFWGQETLFKSGRIPLELDAARLLSVRQRLIGALIRQARQQAGLSEEMLAEKAGLLPESLKSYELGELALSLPQLESIAMSLNKPVRDFLDQNSPVGAWVQQTPSSQGYTDMPPELQEFVAKPINQPYLALAQRLSEMSVDKLRAVAEGLLEITL